MKWVKEINQNSGNFKNSSFLCERKNFIKLLKHGTPFLNGAIKHLGFQNFKVSKDVAIQKFDFLNKYENSKILIIGAGPSTNENSYNISDYDFVWSCNHFYKNEKVKNIKLDLVTLGNENNLSDIALLEYLNRNNTIVSFENKYTKVHEMADIKNTYQDRIFWALTRYHSRIGSIPRLACIAISLGVEEIHFVGMDGYVPIKQRNEYDNSVFEPSKVPIGTIEETSNEMQIISLYKQQYLAMWDYLLHDIGIMVKFKNLGHNHPCNLSTKVLTEKLGENYHEYLYNPRG